MSIHGTFRHENSSLCHSIRGQFETNREGNPTPKSKTLATTFKNQTNNGYILKKKKGAYYFQNNKLLFQWPRLLLKSFFRQGNHEWLA